MLSEAKHLHPLALDATDETANGQRFFAALSMTEISWALQGFLVRSLFFFHARQIQPNGS